VFWLGPFRLGPFLLGPPLLKALKRLETFLIEPLKPINMFLLKRLLLEAVDTLLLKAMDVLLLEAADMLLFEAVDMLPFKLLLLLCKPVFLLLLSAFLFKTLLLKAVYTFLFEAFQMFLLKLLLREAVLLQLLSAFLFKTLKTLLLKVVGTLLFEVLGMLEALKAFLFKLLLLREALPFKLLETFLFKTRKAILFKTLEALLLLSTVFLFKATETLLLKAIKRFVLEPPKFFLLLLLPLLFLCLPLLLQRLPLPSPRCLQSEDSFGFGTGLGSFRYDWYAYKVEIEWISLVHIRTNSSCCAHNSGQSTFHGGASFGAAALLERKGSEHLIEVFAGPFLDNSSLLDNIQMPEDDVSILLTSSRPRNGDAKRSNTGICFRLGAIEVVQRASNLGCFILGNKIVDLRLDQALRIRARSILQGSEEAAVLNLDLLDTNSRSKAALLTSLLLEVVQVVAEQANVILRCKVHAWDTRRLHNTVVPACGKRQLVLLEVGEEGRDDANRYHGQMKLLTFNILQHLWVVRNKKVVLHRVTKDDRTHINDGGNSSSVVRHDGSRRVLDFIVVIEV
jgi:hypothetical protein